MGKIHRLAVLWWVLAVAGQGCYCGQPLISYQLTVDASAVDASAVDVHVADRHGGDGGVPNDASTAPDHPASERVAADRAVIIDVIVDHVTVDAAQAADRPEPRDASAADGSRPDAVVVDVRRPDAAAADVNLPDAAIADVTRPDSAVPDVTRPDRAHHDAAASDGWNVMGPLLDMVAEDYAINPSLGAHSDGSLYVAWNEWDDTIANCYSVFVKTFDGFEWVTLGAQPLDVDARHGSQVPSLVVNSLGHPVVAWNEDRYVNVKRWTGAQWQRLGAEVAYNTAAGYWSGSPQLALGDDDALWLVFDEWGQQAPSNVYVAQWTGGDWTIVGGAELDIDAANNAYAPHIVVDREGHPLVTWEESVTENGGLVDHHVYVKRHNGSSWDLLGGGPITINAGNHTYGPMLAIDSLNRPVLALYHFVEMSSDISTVYVLRWEAAQWRVLGGGSASQVDSAAPALALDADDAPVVAYMESAASQNSIRVVRLMGSSWLDVGNGPLDLDPEDTAASPSLVIMPSGSLVVAWDEVVGEQSFNIYVARY